MVRGGRFARTARRCLPRSAQSASGRERRKAEAMRLLPRVRQARCRRPRMVRSAWAARPAARCGSAREPHRRRAAPRRRKGRVAAGAAADTDLGGGTDAEIGVALPPKRRNVRMSRRPHRQLRHENAFVGRMLELIAEFRGDRSAKGRRRGRRYRPIVRSRKLIPAPGAGAERRPASSALKKLRAANPDQREA